MSGGEYAAEPGPVYPPPWAMTRISDKYRPSADDSCWQDRDTGSLRVRALTLEDLAAA